MGTVIAAIIPITTSVIKTSARVNVNLFLEKESRKIKLFLPPPHVAVN